MQGIGAMNKERFHKGFTDEQVVQVVIKRVIPERFYRESSTHVVLKQQQQSLKIPDYNPRG